MKPMRAYLMLEALIGGAVLAVALSTTIALVGEYRRQTSTAVRRAEASQIALMYADQVMGMPNAATSSGAFATVPGHPNFKFKWALATPNPDPRTLSTPNLLSATDLLEITVEVQFLDNNGATTSILYKRLKRKGQLS